MRDTCVVESFLEVRILHLLRIAELLHEEYKPLSAALLNHVSYELTTAVLGRLRIVKKDIVVHVCKLFCKSSESILLVLRNICTEGTALMSNIISELHELGRSDAWISRHLGMDKDEILRLKQITGLTALFKEVEFGRAWKAIENDLQDEWEEVEK